MKKSDGIFSIVVSGIMFIALVVACLISNI